MEQRGAEAVTANIRAEIARAHLTQARIADALGLTQQSVSDRMRGRTPFTINELFIIADELGVPITSLLPQQVAS